MNTSLSPALNLTLRPILAAVFLSATLAVSPAQTTTAHKPAPKPAPASRSECVSSVGLCVTVPAAWQRLGNVFDDLGFVVAEPHPGVDSAAWPQLTVAAIDTPAHSGGPAPSLDSLVDLVIGPDASSAPGETLQRTRLLLNGASAEIVQVQFHDAAGNADAIEDVALIEGDDGLVYSIALRCAPQDFARLEPLFQQTAQSWRIQPAASAPAPAPQNKQDSKKP